MVSRIFFLVFLTLVASAVNAFAQNTIQQKWDAHLEFEYRDGNDRNIGETELFIPLYQTDDRLTFLDIRGMLDNKDSEEGNIGIGRRKILDKSVLGQKWIVGGYGFLDVRSTKANNKFYQGTFGLEALSEDWDLRTNLYIPESSEDPVAGTANVSAGVIGADLRITGTDNVRERALPGFDTEIGYKLPVFENHIDALRFYGGGFYFDASGYDTVAGPRGRLELSWDDIGPFGENSRFTMGSEVQHDDVRDTTAFGIARLRIPLQKFKGSKTKHRSLSALEKRMTETIVRDVDIVSGQETVGVPVNQAASITVNGTTLSNNVVLLDANDDIPTAVTAAGANATIILDGSVGTINHHATTPIVVQNGQTITGGGLTVTSTDGRFSTTLGTRPTVQRGLGGGPPFSFSINASNVTFENIDIQDGSLNISGGSNQTFKNISVGPASVAVQINNASNVILDNMTVQTSGFAGVILSNVTNATMNNVAVTGSGVHGFRISNSSLSGSGNAVSGAGTACTDAGGNTGSFGLNGGTCP